MNLKRSITANVYLKYCKITVITAILIVSFTQCAVKRTPAMTTGIVDKIALMSTTVNFVQQAGISGPAAVARGQFNNRAEEINSLMTYYVDTLRQAVVRNLRAQLGCEVIYGDDLRALPKYNALKEKYARAEALNKEDEHFPEVVISTGDFNFFIAETKGGVMNGGKTISITADELMAIIPDICEELGIQHIAVAQFVLTGFKEFILFAPDTYVRYNLFLFNHFGELIASSYNNEVTSKLVESDMTGSYENMIRAYLDHSESVELHSVFAKKK